LRELFKEIAESLGVKSEPCLVYACGFIDEGILYKVFRSTSSNLEEGKKRPFIIVHSDKKFCYLILFTSSSFKFKCKKDKIYGIQDETPCIRWTDSCRENTPCKWFYEESKLYKLMLPKGNCYYVLRIPKRFLEQDNFVRCGIYPEEEIPEVIKRIIRGELERCMI